MKKVVVASGNKLAIGDDLKKALENLLSQNAVDIEVENTDDIEGLIEEIIKANTNLTESNESNDWELMGSDIRRLQELINSLDQMIQAEEEESQTDEQQSIGNEVDASNSSNENIDNSNVNDNAIDETLQN